MNYESSTHITNSSDRTLCFQLEPWGEQFEMRPDATFVVVAEADVQGFLEVEYEPNVITVWGWPRSSVRLFLDGKEIGTSRLAVPPVPAGQSVSSFLGRILGRKKFL